MINKYQTIYTGANLNAPSSGILAIYALGAGTVKNVRVKVKTANTAGDTVFNLSKNGVDLFTDELTIEQNETVVSLTGQSIAVVFGDILVLKLDSIATGGVIAPIAVQVESEELLVLSSAELLQLKSDLALTKSDVGLSNVDNTSDATKNAAVATLTNKTISGANNTISNLAEGALNLSDVTTGNASTTKHGFMPKLDNDPTHFINGQGNWAPPPSGGSVNLVSFGLTEQANTFSDSFATLDTVTNWTAASASGGTAPAVSSGAAQLNPGTLNNGVASLVSKTAFNLLNKEIIIDVLQVPALGGSNCAAQLLLNPSATLLTSYHLIQYASASGNMSTTLNQTAKGTTPAYNSTNHKFWKFRIINNYVYSFVSADAINWTYLSSASSLFDLDSAFIWLRVANFAAPGGALPNFQINNLVVQPLMAIRWDKLTQVFQFE
jgi:hypothetical protein